MSCHDFADKATMALLHFLFLFLFLFLIHSFSAEDIQISKCEGGNYTVNSIFGSNLNLLLSNLSSSSLLFSTVTIHGSTNSVYGLVLCRGDLDPSSCTTCYKMLAHNVTQLCTLSREATVWDRMCELRYSDKRFFNSIDTDVYEGFYNTQSLTDTYANEVKELFDSVSYQAAYNSSNLFATGKLSYSETPIYSLAQCTMDISWELCRQCLQNILDFYLDCCRAQIGGWFIGKSCNYRYEVSQFYVGDPTIVLTLPPTSPAPAPAPTPLVSPPARETASQNGGGKVIDLTPYCLIGKQQKLS